MNAYSTLNRGDAVILEGVLASLRAAGARHITVATPSEPGEAERRLGLGADEVAPMAFDLLRVPQPIRRFYPIHAMWVAWNLALITLRALLRPDSSAALLAYRNADLVVSSGGAYLGGPRPGINFLTAYQIALAGLAGRGCIVAPVTVKPMSLAVKLIVRLGLSGTVIFGRDKGTVRRLRALGIDARLAADLAFRAPAASVRRRASSGRRRLTVAWAPREFGWDSDAYRFREAIEAATREALTRLVRESGTRLLVVTQSNAPNLENDLVAIERVVPGLPADVQAAAEVLSPAVTLEEAIRAYARAHVVYAYRLHAAVLALMAGTPSIVLDYEPKVQGVLRLLQLEDWVIKPAEACDSALVVARLLSVSRRTARSRINAALARAERMTRPFDDEVARRLGRLAARSDDVAGAA